VGGPLAPTELFLLAPNWPPAATLLFGASRNIPPSECIGPPSDRGANSARHTSSSSNYPSSHYTWLSYYRLVLWIIIGLTQLSLSRPVGGDGQRSDIRIRRVYVVCAKERRRGVTLEVTCDLAWRRWMFRVEFIGMWPIVDEWSKLCRR